MSMPGAPQDDQRNAITMALMGIANPPGKGQMPQYPQQPGFGPGMVPPKNISQGMTAIGNAMGGMGQPPQQPGAPMSLAPPPQQPPPMAPPQAQPMAPQGPPVGADPQMPQMPQGPQGLY
jgi:hypothetical protein